MDAFVSLNKFSRSWDNLEVEIKDVVLLKVVNLFLIRKRNIKPILYSVHVTRLFIAFYLGIAKFQTGADFFILNSYSQC